VFFFFGAYHIIICGVSGIGMLFTKGHRGIGILALLAAILFYIVLRDIGDTL
jgi:hypothetical protein